MRLRAAKGALDGNVRVERGIRRSVLAFAALLVAAVIAILYLGACAPERMPRTPEERLTFCENLKVQRDAIMRFPGSDQDRAVFLGQVAAWSQQARCPGAADLVVEWKP
jgi:chromosome condensin MukBEF MukE localization factor